MAGSLNTFALREDLIPQTEPLNEQQVKNNAGGYVYKISPLDAIKRFLILGSEGSFYRTGIAVTKESAKTIIAYVEQATAEQQRELIDLIVEYSVAGRAPKQQPGLFALALVISVTKDDAVRAYGYQQVNKVARTGTSLFEFISFMNQFKRFGMGARKAFARWYTEKTPDQLAYQLAKYRNRAGFTHADVIKISREIKTDEATNPKQHAAIRWALGKDFDSTQLPLILKGVDAAKHSSDPREVESIIKTYGLTWEMIPTEMLSFKEVWQTLIATDQLPLTAMVRNLSRLTRLGVFDDDDSLKLVLSRLSDSDRITKSRIHPLNVLIALKTYSQGRGILGSDAWSPVKEIENALESMFYQSYGNVEPTEKRFMLALDVSGSMTWGNIAGVPITPAEAVTALTMVTLNVEKSVEVVGFSRDLVNLPLLRGMTLNTAMDIVFNRSMGATDAAAPIEYALKKKIPVDVFVVMTDNETWSGRSHPMAVLKKYREVMGIDAKMIVLATSTSHFSICDPDDPRTLDIAGFDSATPQIISAFASSL